MQILIIQPKIGIGDMVIYLPYIHAISKNYKKSVSILVKDNSRAKELLAEDNHIKEIIKSDYLIDTDSMPLKYRDLLGHFLHGIKLKSYTFEYSIFHKFFLIH